MGAHEPHQWHRAWQRLAPALIILLSLFTFSSALSGSMPVSHDHPVHFFKGWQFVEQLLPQGSLFGWSNNWFFGYPPGALYTLLPDVWIALWRGLTFGAFTWEYTYTLAFVSAMIIGNWSVFALGRRLLGTTVGFIGAALVTLDAGGWQQGGWLYTIEVGVWAQPFAMAWFFLALVQLDKLKEGGGKLPMILAPLFMGLAILGHQMTVLLGGLALPIYVLSHLVEGRPQAQRALKASAYTLALGSLLSAFWMLPFLARRSWALNIGRQGESGDRLLGALISGDLFIAGWPIFIHLAWVGLALAIHKRKWAPIMLGGVGVTMVLLATNLAKGLLTALHPAFSNILFERLLIAGKPCFWLLGAYGAVSIWMWLVPIAKGGASSKRLAALGGLGLMALGAGGMLLVDVIGAKERSDALPMMEDVAWGGDYEDYLTWAKEAKAEEPEFFRIAYLVGRNNHRYMSAPVYTGIPYYRVGYTPVKLFRHAPETGTPPLLRDLSVKYIVTFLEDEAPHIRKIKEFGDLKVFEFRDYRPERYTLRGPGAVTSAEVQDHKMAFTVEGAGAGSFLKVHVSNFDRWEARVKGEIVAIKEAPVMDPDPRPMLMEIPVEDGEVTFEWVTRPVDHAGVGLSILGLLLIFGLPFTRFFYVKLNLHRDDTAPQG